MDSNIQNKYVPNIYDHYFTLKFKINFSKSYNLSLSNERHRHRHRPLHRYYYHYNYDYFACKSVGFKSTLVTYKYPHRLSKEKTFLEFEQVSCLKGPYISMNIE